VFWSQGFCSCFLSAILILALNKGFLNLGAAVKMGFTVNHGKTRFSVSTAWNEFWWTWNEFNSCSRLLGSRFIEHTTYRHQYCTGTGTYSKVQQTAYTTHRTGIYEWYSEATSWEFACAWAWAWAWETWVTWVAWAWAWLLGGVTWVKHDYNHATSLPSWKFPAVYVSPGFRTTIKCIASLRINVSER